MKVEDKTKEQFIDELAELRQRVTDLEASAALHTETEETLVRTYNQLEFVGKILRSLNSTLNVAEALPAISVDLRAIAGCECSSLALLDDSHEWFTTIALDGHRSKLCLGAKVDTRGSPVIEDLLAGRPHLTPDLASELDSPVERALYQAGYRSRIVVPLRVGEGVVGGLTLGWFRPSGYDATTLPLLSQIADALALFVERSRLFEQVYTGRKKLQALSRRLLEVQEAQRRKIARDLHDEIGQTLTGLKLSLEMIPSLPAGAPRTSLEEARMLADELMTRVHDLSLDLRPAMLDDLGLLPTLLWYFERYTAQTNVKVTFEHTGVNRRFPPETETAAYRIVQAALTNVALHANVGEVAVRTWTYQSTLRVQVEDQGTGFDPDAVLAGGATSGLPGMRERAVLLGGHLEVESAPGAGTRLNAELPLGNPAAEGNGEKELE